MPKINILNIQPGDAQTILIDKINYNFDQLLTAGGGPQGLQGQIGLVGPIGPQGVQGPPGPSGSQGSRWFVQNDAPTSSIGGIEGNNPWIGPQLGDYWLCGTSNTGYNQYGIYVYANSNGSFQWLDSGIKFSITSEFSEITNLNAGIGLTTAVVRDSTSKDNPNFGFVLSDYWVTGSGATSYVGTNGSLPIQYQINSDNSKLKIATASGSSTTRLISFGRADKDTQNYSSATYSGAYNPYIAWNNPNPSTDHDYALNIQNPQDNINITVGATGGIFLEGDTISLDATSTYNGIFNVSGSVFTITRNPYGSGQPDQYTSTGSGEYTVSGSYINFQPGYILGNNTPGNFVVGSSLSSGGIGGSKGIVINSASTSGNYLVLKSSANAAGQIYGGIVAESYNGNSGLAGINLSIGIDGSSTDIDFNVNGSFGYQNRMSLLGNGNLVFNYGTNITGSNRDVLIYVQNEITNTTGANLKLAAGLSNGGNYQGGTLYMQGGGGGGNNGSSGNVVINPGSVNGAGNQLGSIYLQSNTLSQLNTAGVAIGLSEGTNVEASLVVADTNIGVTGGNILLLQKNGTSGPSTFFGFDKSGYLTNGLPYNPSLTSNYLSSDPHNLDYYEEGTWTPVLTPRGNVIGSHGESWSNSVYNVIKSNYTRVGDLVCVDFTLELSNPISIFNSTSGTSADTYLYLNGFPYKPDYERTSGYSTSGGIYPITDYTKPVMPMIPIKGIGFQKNTIGSVPPGAIQAWPGTIAPPGWHICDGSQFDYAANPEYQDLFNVIGFIYTPGYGYGQTIFSIPDLRGQFIRGLNASDSDLPDSARGLGTIQQDSYKKHQHYIPTGGDNRIDDNDRTPANDTSNGYIQGRNNPDGRVNPSKNPRTDHPEDSDGTNYGAGNIPGDTVDFRDPTLSGFPAAGLWTNHFTCESGVGTETRPVNMALNYIIYLGTSTSNTAIQEFSGSFVQEGGNTNMYLYNFNGNLSTSSIPSSGAKYLYGSFSYFTFSNT